MLPDGHVRSSARRLQSDAAFGASDSDCDALGDPRASVPQRRTAGRIAILAVALVQVAFVAAVAALFIQSRSAGAPAGVGPESRRRGSLAKIPQTWSKGSIENLNEVWQTFVETETVLDTVTLDVTVGCVELDALAANATLKSAFENSCKEDLANCAGLGVSASDVLMSLRSVASSVVISVTIVIPMSATTSNVFDTIRQCTGSPAWSFGQRLQGIDGIGDALTCTPTVTYHTEPVLHSDQAQPVVKTATHNETMVSSMLGPTHVDGSTLIGMCMVDVAQGSSELAQSGLAISEMVEACKSPTPNSEAKSCPAALAKSISSVLFAIAYITGAASDCAGSMKTQLHMRDAQCAASVAGFSASLSQIASRGMKMATACRKDLDDSEARALLQPRRLTEADLVGLLPASAPDAPMTLQRQGQRHQQQVQLAKCTIDVSSAALYLARATAAITGAVKDCSSSELRNHGDGYFSVGKNLCAVDVNGVVGSFSHIASFLFEAMSECSNMREEAAFCASNVAGLLADLASLVSTANHLAVDCHRDRWKMETGRLIQGNQYKVWKEHNDK